MERLYNNLTELISQNLNTPETKSAKKLIEELHEIKKRRFFTKEEFYKIAMWKSPRPKKLYLKNSEEEIENISKKVLSSNSLDEKINLLTSLKGVSIAVASAILTIIEPKNYGIIDIRVWQLLHLYTEVKTNPAGQGFKLDDYKNYLIILKDYSKKFQINVRDIERILFFQHRKIQEGNLYK